MKRTQVILLGLLVGALAFGVSQLAAWRQTAPQPRAVLLADDTANLAVSPSDTPTLPAVALPTETPAGPAVIPLVMHEPLPVSIGPDDFPAGVNPLTGLMVDDPSLLERRPLVVKVTNYPRTVRPQSGLSFADLVFEYYMEHGISRFVAVYYGTDAPRVGPVRSGRYFDQHIFQMYDGFFIYGFADDRVYDFFQTLDDYWPSSFIVDNGRDVGACDADNPAYLCRDTALLTYNNLFANTALLTQVGENRGLNHAIYLSGMRFSQQTPTGGLPGLNLRVRHSLLIYNKWEYDVAAGRYLRWQETIGDADPDFEAYAPQLDALTGEQLAADNVVVLFVPHYYFVKTETTEIVNIPLYGRGDAIVFRDGYAFGAQWRRPGLEEGVLQLWTLDGEPFALKPGNTWFQVLSPESAVAQDGASWRFVLTLPPEGSAPINPLSENPPWGIYQDEIFAGMPVTPTPGPTPTPTATKDK